MKFVFALMSLFFSFMAFASDDNILRVFTWEGYVTDKDVAAVNKVLEAEKNPVRVKVIPTWAEGPEQMYQIIREGKCDLSFLTLNYIKADKEKTAKLLQTIDISKLKNYSSVVPSLKSIGMGIKDDSKQPFYVPFGGGAYGIWANMKKIKKEDLPTSINDLKNPKWKDKLSLTSGQIQPNIALALMAAGKAPFLINDLIIAGKKEEAQAVQKEIQPILNQIYAQIKPTDFWANAPDFKDHLSLVAGYGPEIAALKAKGEDWQLVNFKEGNTVWLDTMNIMASVQGDKLKAAYAFIDYFLSDAVQNRVVDSLSMVAVTTAVKNPLLEKNANFFDQKLFWPPYDIAANNIMRSMSDAAMKK